MIHLMLDPLLPDETQKRAQKLLGENKKLWGVLLCQSACSKLHQIYIRRTCVIFHLDT